jgi:hypothetical protein
LLGIYGELSADLDMKGEKTLDFSELRKLVPFVGEFEGLAVECWGL